MQNKIIAIAMIHDSHAELLKHVQELVRFSEAHTLLLINQTEDDFSLAEIPVIKTETKNEVSIIKEVLDRQGEEGDVLLIGETFAFSQEAILSMQQVLYMAEKHAAVSPRMANGSYLNLPYVQKELLSEEEIMLACNTAKKVLPKYTKIPTAFSDCVLLKRNVVFNLGFLDDSYISLAIAVKDYCVRINQYGFSSVLANHVYLQGSPVKSPADKKDIRIFNERFPYFEKIEQTYLKTGMNACDYFYDLILEQPNKKKKLLFDFFNMLPMHNGTTEYQLALLENFTALFSDRYEISLYTNHAGAAYHRLEERFPNIAIYYPETIKEQTFHIGFSATQPLYLEQYEFLNRHCFKVVFTMLDIIMSRCHYLQSEDLLRDDIMRLGVELSDGIVAISQFSKDDFSAYFAEEPIIENASIKCVYIATDFGKNAKDEGFYKLPFDDYYLIIGNSFKHKVILETIHALKNTDKNYIVVGYGENALLYPNIYGYTSGQLSEGFLNRLYQNCNALIFPSLYEGFGLPILIALKNGKRVICNENALNKELYQYFDTMQDSFFFYRTFHEIQDIVNKIDSLPPLGRESNEYAWKDSVVEIESYLQEILSREIDPAKLNHRWHLFNLIQAKRCEGISTQNSNGHNTLKSALVRRLKRFPKLFAGLKKGYYSLHRKRA